jgi:PGF-pre-PGF domain-containing protein
VLKTTGIIITTLSPNSSIAGSTSAFMNFTVNDPSNTTAWYNITFPGGFDVSNANLNYNINGSDNQVSWINSTSTLYVNISSTDTSITANSNMVQYINLSNITIASTRGNYLINVTTSNGITVSLNYTINEYGTNLTSISALSLETSAGNNATYTLILENNGSAADSYNLSVVNANSASTAALDISGNITLGYGASQTLLLNVTNTSSGTFRVNVTARSNNDTSKIGYINTTTIVPIVITITNPANGSTTNDSYVNVTVILDAYGLAQYLNWDGVNYSMIPNTSNALGTVFYRNMTDILSGNYSFKVYANDIDGNTNVSETRTVTVDRKIIANLSIDPITGNVSQTMNLSSPGGNVTISIFNGTNATLVDGTPIANITIDTLNNMNYTALVMLGSDKLIGENISAGPEGAHFRPDIQIRFNYTDSMLLAEGISASELRVKFFNTSNNIWVIQEPYTLNETGKYVIANVSHFSTFALVGTTTNPTTTNPTTTTRTNGGDGSSDKGVVTSEPYDNIARSETYKNNLLFDKPAVYTFKLTEHGIYEITVTDKQDENNIALRVEALKGQTRIAGISAPPGSVYKNVNVWSGSKNIRKALIKFKVENTWILNNKVESGDLVLVKWDGSQWVKLVTLETMKDDTYCFYEANTDSFASFAITALKGGAVPNVSTVIEDMDKSVSPVKPAGKENHTPEPTNKIPGFEVIVSVFAIGLLAAGFRKYLK